jgi:pilus assembly protein CpaE
VFSSSVELSASLREVGHLEVVDHVSMLGSLADVIHRQAPQLLIADLGDEPDAVLDELNRIPVPRPVLLITGPEDDSRAILRAMRLGAREYLPPEPDAYLLETAVERLALEEPPPPSRESRAPVVAVMGAKGGVGSTFLACQLSTTLQRLGANTVLTDMNLRLGDVSLFFDLKPRYTLADLAAEREDFDFAYVDTLLETHSSGVRVLAAPGRPEDAETFRAAQLERAVEIFREEFDWVVLDVSRSWDEVSLRALDLADQVLLVTSTDVAALHHARQHLDLLERLGHSALKIRLVLNRHDKSDPVSNSDIAEFIGREPEFRIPNDYRATVACVNEGKPLWEVAPRGALSSAYGSLSEQVHDWCHVERPTPSSPPSRARATPSWLSGLRRRRHGSD